MKNKPKQGHMQKFFAENPNYPTITMDVFAPIIIKWGLWIVGILIIGWIILKIFGVL